MVKSQDLLESCPNYDMIYLRKLYKICSRPYFLIHPHFLYGRIIGGNTYITCLKRLTTLQNRAVEILVEAHCYSKLACFGFKLKPFALQDSNHYVFEQKTFCNMRKGTPISIIDKMSCLLSPYIVDELFCLVMFSFFFLDP